MIQGLFGGTFNPLHRGHVEVILHVKKAFNLDRIYLIPSAVPPHKPLTNLAPAKDRFNMVKRSVAGMDGIVASDVEILRRGPSFTVDTVKHFIKILPADTELCLIVGSDAFFEMDTWEKGKSLFSLISTIVMTRPGEKKQAEDVASFLQNVISKNYMQADGKGLFNGDCLVFMPISSNSGLKPVYVCKVPAVNISSTLIRERVKKHLSVAEHVPQPVEEIIIKKGLYL